MKIHIGITDDKGNHYVGTAELVKAKYSDSSISKKSITNKKEPKAPEIIHKLYTEKFFRTAKKQQEIMLKLRAKGFNFDEATIRMALIRANYLKKEENGQSNKYIQKFPPN